MRQIPQIVQITQRHSQPEVVDPYQAVLDAWNASDFAQRLKPGKTVGIGVGSRGIANIEKMVLSGVPFWEDGDDEWRGDEGWSGDLVIIWGEHLYGVDDLEWGDLECGGGGEFGGIGIEVGF